MKVRLLSSFLTGTLLVSSAASAQPGARSGKDAGLRTAVPASEPITSLPAARSFYMGFSPWPYDLSLDAVKWTDKAIKDHGDIIEQHFEEGVPWPEAFANRPYQSGMEEEINNRVRRMGNCRRVVSISPINTTRTGLALYRGQKFNMPLPPLWRNKRFNDPAVKTAYLQYVERIIETMRPDYLVIGVEVNLLQRCADSSWQDYLELHRHIYEAVKSRHPLLPVMASVVCTSYFAGLEREDNPALQRQELKKLLPYVDIIGFSVHPFMSAWTAEKVPDCAFFKELFSLAGDKPFAITESSYPAQRWVLTLGHVKVPFNGTQEKQAAFLKSMLDSSLRARPAFVSWFSIRDYDQLWSRLKEDPAIIAWRDTGLFDENGKPRKALALWDSVLTLTRHCQR